MSIDYKTFGQGNFKKTSSRSGKFTGPKHSNGGIKTAGPDGNMIEVEGGESVGEVNTNIGKQPYIYSQYVKRHGGVSYADEFDKMVNRGAPQQELDMLASEQDSKAKRIGGSVQVTPMQRGGFTNNINNNTMTNRLSTRIMQHDSRYRNGGIPKYQDTGIIDYTSDDPTRTYSGKNGDVGQNIIDQRNEAVDARKERGETTGNWFSKLINTMLYMPTQAGQTLTQPGMIIGDMASDTPSSYGANPFSTQSWNDQQGYWSQDPNLQQQEPFTGQYGGMPNQQNNQELAQYGIQTGVQPQQPQFKHGGVHEEPQQYGGGGLQNIMPFMFGPVIGSMMKAFSNKTKEPEVVNTFDRNRNNMRNNRIFSMEDYNNSLDNNSQPMPANPNNDRRMVQRGGLTNRVMQYQTGGITNNEPTNIEGQRQWENFMTSDHKDQQKSPTRRDVNEEFIRKVIQSMPYNPEMY